MLARRQRFDRHGRSAKYVAVDGDTRAGRLCANLKPAEDRSGLGQLDELRDLSAGGDLHRNLSPLALGHDELDEMITRRQRGLERSGTVWLPIDDNRHSARVGLDDEG